MNDVSTGGSIIKVALFSLQLHLFIYLFIFWEWKVHICLPADLFQSDLSWWCWRCVHVMIFSSKREGHTLKCHSTLNDPAIQKDCLLLERKQKNYSVTEKKSKVPIHYCSSGSLSVMLISSNWTIFTLICSFWDECTSPADNQNVTQRWAENSRGRLQNVHI